MLTRSVWRAFQLVRVSLSTGLLSSLHRMGRSGAWQFIHVGARRIVNRPSRPLVSYAQQFCKKHQHVKQQAYSHKKQQHVLITEVL